MRHAIEETNRRREKQVAYNLERGLDPQPLRKRVVDIIGDLVRDAQDATSGGSPSGGDRRKTRGTQPAPTSSVGRHAKELANLPAAELARLIQTLDEQMHDAARELQFEVAARLRDEIGELKRELRQMQRAVG
jgi:excinuclease ABC subunit B